MSGTVPQAAPSRPPTPHGLWSRPVGRVLRLAWEPRVVLGVYLLLTLQFALGDPGNPARIVWGHVALVAYAVAWLLSWALPRRPLVAVGVALLGALVVPLVTDLARGLRQSEVQVVKDGAHQLLTTGDFYLTDPSTVHVYTDYRPYLTTLFAFGLPSRVPVVGRVLDPRVVVLVLLAGVLAYLCRTHARRGADAETGRPRRLPGVEDPWHARLVGLGLVLAYPTVALLAATSFIDLPQATLSLLGLLLVDRGRPTAAGVALGLTLATKPTAPAVLFVVLLWVWHRDGPAGGRRAALRLAAVAVAVGAILVVPFLAVSPRAMWTNVVLYPTGRTAIVTPAASNLPGALLDRALAGTAWAWLPSALIVLVGLAFAIGCLLRPPSSLLAAALVAGAGLSLAFLLAPQTRTGYFVIPIFLVAPIVAVEHAPPPRLSRASRRQPAGVGPS